MLRCLSFVGASGGFCHDTHPLEGGSWLDPRTRRLQRGSDVEWDARRKRRAHAPARVPSAPAPNATLLGVLMCLPTAPMLPPEENGDFGMSPIYGQLSDKPLLAFIDLYEVPDGNGQ